jgi:hypothetical protein
MALTNVPRIVQGIERRRMMMRLRRSKQKNVAPTESHVSGGKPPRSLFQEKEMTSDNSGMRKRKPDNKTDGTLDLNALAADMGMIVLYGLVSDRIAQLGSPSGRAENDNEVQKKQKTTSSHRARSVAVTGSDPRRAQ